MKKAYMRPEMAAFWMEAESLVCLSGSDKAADPAKDILIKGELDFEEELRKFENPLEGFDFGFPMK